MGFGADAGGAIRAAQLAHQRLAHDHDMYDAALDDSGDPEYAEARPLLPARLSTDGAHANNTSAALWAELAPPACCMRLTNMWSSRHARFLVPLGAGLAAGHRPELHRGQARDASRQEARAW